MILVDAHCHLEPKDFPQPEAVIERAREAGVVHAVVVGQLQMSGGFGHAVELARTHPAFLTATVGIHPHEANAATADDWVEVERLVALREVAAVGETGLDFFYRHAAPEAQMEAFRRHCQLARAQKKPLVVHVRDAHVECAEVLRGEGVCSGMIHCFTGDTEAARRYLDLGFFLSVSGMVTYPKTESLQAAIAFAPLDRLMVETDSPYLAPVPHRGKRPNEPAWVVETARKVAQLKGCEVDEVALCCARNAVSLFRLPVGLGDL